MRKKSVVANFATTAIDAKYIKSIIINCNYLAFLGSSNKGKIETVAKFAQVRKEGKREVFHYNLDVIISVGYRVKSKQDIL